MVERAEENKEGDGSDMRALEGDWGRRPTSRRKLPEEGRLWPRYAAGDERAESDGLFKAATSRDQNQRAGVVHDRIR
jgi:hypothetical protein